MAAWLVLSIGAGWIQASEPAPQTVTLARTEENTSWTVSYEGRKVLVYSFAPQMFKPYVKELCTLEGDNVLRDAPADHLHHHGLMYAIKVNGLNFWEEVSGNGIEKVIQTEEPRLGLAKERGNELPQVTLSQLLHWVSPQDAFLPNSASVALLVEHRTLRLTIDPAAQEVALEWNSRFEVGAKTNTVILGGANYHGLGMRFRQDLDVLASHAVAGVRPDLANNRQDTSVATWSAVSFDAPGRPATIVLAGHPLNARGQPTFFSMKTPFAYLSATQALDKETLVYHRGESFTLSYLVLLCGRIESSGDINKRVLAWREQVRH